MGIATVLRAARIGTLAGAAMMASLTAAAAAEDGARPERQDWPFDGIFGTVDRASAQRGLQVYLEACAGCHGLHHVYYRHLADLGFNDDQIRAIAADYEVTDGPDDMGEMFQRPAVASDRFVSPFPNDRAAAAANNGAVPPDLSLQVRAHAAGPDYIYALLTGYTDPPPDVTVPPGMNYNPYFPGSLIAMPQPLFEDMIGYTDGTEATVEQMAWDVTNFMQWTASPEMEQRKRTGYKVIIFLLVLSAILFAAKQKIWKGRH